jgi:hypothetical protein
MSHTVYYRVTDPLENFKLRVTVREIPKKDATVSDITSLPIPIEIDLSWQEKLLGPR